MRRLILFSGLLLLAAACERDPMLAVGPEPSFRKGGGPPSPKCRVGFTLELDETGRMRSDRLSPSHLYRDKVEQVMVATSGTGLRFDTNTDQSKESPTDVRRVRLDFSGTGYEAVADPSVPKGIDLRFDAGSFPINLCGMQPGDVVDEPAVLTFMSSDDGHMARLSWGWIPGYEDEDGPNAYDCDSRAPMAPPRLTVTKNLDGTWTVTGDRVCLYTGFLGHTFRGVISMPIGFTLTQQ